MPCGSVNLAYHGVVGRGGHTILYRHLTTSSVNVVGSSDPELIALLFHKEHGALGLRLFKLITGIFPAETYSMRYLAELKA